VEHGGDCAEIMRQLWKEVNQQHSEANADQDSFTQRRWQMTTLQSRATTKNRSVLYR